jgi:type I restriction enzyme S subunit
MSGPYSKAPTGRKTKAQGIALGARPKKNTSPEGAIQQSEWRIAKIGDFAATTSGGTPSRAVSAYYNGTIPWIKSGNLNDGLVSEADEFITEDALKNSSAKLFPAGTLMIALYGATIGKLGLLSIEAATNQAVCGIFVPEEAETKYLFYFLLYHRPELIKLGAGGAQPNISQGIIRDIEVPLPPLPEQRRIVARIEELFSRLDAGVAALRHAKAQLQRYRQSVLAAAVTGQLTQAWREQHPDTEPSVKLLKRVLEQRLEQWDGKGKYRDALGPDRPSALPEIPANWIWTTLDSLCISKVGNAFKSAQFKDAGVRLLRGENIEPGALRWANTRYWPESNIAEFQDLLVDQGDVIIAMDRPLISSGLKVAVAKKEDTPCLLVQRVTRLRPIGPITSTFIFTNINTKRFVDQLIGNQTGTQIPHITEKGIRCFAIPLPPLAEQHQIVAEVEARTTAIDHLEAELDRQITRSNRLRQSTLKSAFNGSLS